MEYPDLQDMEYLDLTKMDYLELPDGSTSYLHLLKNRDTIWDVNNDPRMYEVQILHGNNEDFDKNFEDILNMNSVHCSICNLDVPKMYLKQHNNTSIHQNLIKLTDEVLERTKNHLKTNDEPTNASLNVTDTFFCETCSKIIQNNDRNNHLESKFHRTQINFEKILKFFIEAYLGVNKDVELNVEALKDFIESNELSLLKHTSDLPDQISMDPYQIQNVCETTVSKDPSDITMDPSQTKNPCETTVSKTPSINDTVIDIFDPNYLKQLLESGRDESHSPEPQNLKTVKKRNLPNLQISTELSKKEPTIGKDPTIGKEPSIEKHPTIGKNPTIKKDPTIGKDPTNGKGPTVEKDPNIGKDPVSKDTKSEHSDNQTNLNPMTPSFYPTNTNLNPMTPSFNPTNTNLNPKTPIFNPNNPNFNHMSPGFNPVNPNFNFVYPSYNPVNSNFIYMAPSFNPMNPNLNNFNPNYKPMNPYFHHMNPNLNPMNVTWNPINPYFNFTNPMNVNWNPVNPNFNTMNPHLNAMNPNINPKDPQSKKKPNLNPKNPNLNPMNPNLNPIKPNLEHTNPNINPINPIKPTSDPTNPNFNPNLNPIKSNSEPMNPNTNPINPIKPNLDAMNQNINPINPNLNPIKPNLDPKNPNINPINPNLNSIKLNSDPTNPNFNPIKSNSEPMNPNTNPIKPNLDPKNPNINPMNPIKPNLDPKNPNINPINPNLNPLKPSLDPTTPKFNHINPNLNPLKPSLDPTTPKFNPINPNLNPLKPNLDPQIPYFNPMNPYINPMHPNIHPMHPNINPMHPNINPMHPNINPIHPNINPMHPNINPMHPNLNIINTMNPHCNLNSNSQAIDPQHKLGPNLNPLDPKYNLNPTEPQLNSSSNFNLNTVNNSHEIYWNNLLYTIDSQSKLGPNFITLEPQFKLGPNTNLNTMEPQFKLGPNTNLNTMEPQSKLGSNLNLNTLDPQSKLGSNTNLNTMEPQFKLGSNFTLNTLDPQSKLGTDTNSNTMEPQSKLGSNFNLNTLDPQSKLGTDTNSNTMEPQSKLGSNFNFNTLDPQSKLGTDTNLNTMEPQSKFDSNFNFNTLDPQSKLGSNFNLISLNPQSKVCANFNLNTLDPQSKLGPNSNLNTMDSQFKLDSNANENPLESKFKLGFNLNTPNPQFKLGSNVNKLDLQFKLGSNLNTPDPQFKLGSNLNTLDPKFKLGPNLNKKDLKPIPTETKMLIKSINKAERKREQQIKNVKAFEEFSSYIQTIQDYNPEPGFQIEPVSTSKVKVTALNGDCVLVPRHNFESNDGKYCRVCQNGNLAKDHAMSEEHISRLMVPVADKHCIREVDDIWSHCIICNLLIKFVEDHIKSSQHLTKLKKCFIDIPKQTEENKANIIVPEEEGINKLSTEKERYDQKKKEEKRVDSQENVDADNFSCTVVDKLLPLFAKSDPTKEIATDSNKKKPNEPLEDKKKDTVEVAKKTNEVKQLKKTIQTMVDKDKSLTDETKYDDEVATETDIKYCSICKINVSDFESHKTSKSHIKNNDYTKKLRDIVDGNNLKELKDSTDLLRCELCDVNVNYLSVDEHVNSEVHKRIFFKFTGYNKIILINEVVSQCEPCNKSIQRSILFDHCKQEKHIKKLKDLINITSNQKPVKNKIKKESKSIENKPIVQNEDVTKMLYHFRAQDVEFICKTCHAIIPRDAASVKGHVESKQHVEKYSILLNSNKIFKTTTGSLYCEVCNAQIPMTGEIVHIFGKTHNDKLVLKVNVPRDESKVTRTMTINIPVAGPSSVPIVGTFVEVLNKEKDIKIPLYVKYQYKDLAEKHPICLICEKKVPKSEITNHVLSTSHNINFNLVMINNTINIKGNAYECVCCSRSLPLFGEIDHIFGKLHLNNKKSLRVGSVGKSILTYDHVLNLPQGKRMVKY